MQSPTLNKIVTSGHILKSMKKCEEGVRWKSSVQMFEVNTLRNGSKIKKTVLKRKYKMKGLHKFYIVERGKRRFIQSMHISDRTVQKMFCEYALKPVVYPQLVYDNPASREGMGTSLALKRLKEHLRYHFARHGKTGYILLIDFHDYFAKISHKKASEMLIKHQNDIIVCDYLKGFVNAFDGEYGLGLGSESSQIGAIFYPTSIDKLIKEKLHVHCSLRYMDDTYLIHESRNYLLHCYELIKNEAKKLEIEINEKKTKLNNLASDDFVFLKKRVRIYNNGKIIMRITRKNIMEQEKKIIHNKNMYLSGIIPFVSILQSYQSWRSYAQTCNTNEAVHNMDKFFYREMREIIYKETGMRHISFSKPPIGKIMKKKGIINHENHCYA